MIKKLKRRMVLLVLAGLLLVSAGLVFTINFMNWNSIERQASAVLDMLAENSGQRPDFMQGEPFPRDGGLPPDEDDRELFRLDHRGNDKYRARNNPDVMNAASLSNFYTVTLDQDGSVVSWKSDRADLYADEEIEEMAESVMKLGEASGRIDTRFFRLTEANDAGERLLIVVDGRLEIQNALSVLRFTALVAVIEDALLSAAAVWLIQRLIRPVDEAMEKQKQFVWDASHELKTPLAVISANAEALEGEMGEAKPLQYIRSEVERTDQLIQNLLTLARMERGTVTAQRVKFDLSRAMMEVALPFESAVFEAGKEMELLIPDGIEYTGDEEMIKQLTVILLSNAQKYSNDGGKIRVSLEAKGEKRMIRVYNTGAAIPQEAQARIFDRFYRVDSSHNREIEGNGLGLAIAQSIVDAHKGKITVHSQEGEGTTFTVIL